MWSSITKRPLVIFALFFSLGIYTASQIKVYFWIVYIIALIFLLLTFLSLKKRLLFDIFFSCLVFLSALSLLKNAQALPKQHILNFVSYKNNHPYIIKGYVKSQPLFKDKSTSFVFKAEDIQYADFRYKTCGNILVRIKGRKDLVYGEGLILQGNLFR
ncbi:MAG: DUF4131 domain-containing protein, partial [Candidatus Omnitrophota bacterium]